MSDLLMTLHSQRFPLLYYFSLLGYMHCTTSVFTCIVRTSAHALSVDFVNF